MRSTHFQAGQSSYTTDGAWSLPRVQEPPVSGAKPPWDQISGIQSMFGTVPATYDGRQTMDSRCEGRFRVGAISQAPARPCESAAMMLHPLDDRCREQIGRSIHDASDAKSLQSVTLRLPRRGTASVTQGSREEV